MFRAYRNSPWPKVETPNPFNYTFDIKKDRETPNAIVIDENVPEEIIEIVDDDDVEEEEQDYFPNEAELMKARKKVDNWMLKCEFNADIDASEVSVEIEKNSMFDNDNDSLYSSVSRSKSRKKNANALNPFKQIDPDTDKTPNNWQVPEQNGFKPLNNSVDRTSVAICAMPSTEKYRELPWTQLKARQVYDVNITAFSSSDEFFVELADYQVRKQLNRRLLRARPVQLTDIEPGDYCLVEYFGEYHRAMVNFHNPSALSSMCYSVDTGKTFYFNGHPAPIYKMSSKIRKTIPFQAIRCSFNGLKIVNNSELLSYIDVRVLKFIKKPQIFVFEINETSDDNTDPMKAMDLHKVILYDGADERNINEILIELKLAGKNSVETINPNV